MTTVPWQLIPVEDAELEPIDLKTGASLLGRGQRASPGIEDNCVCRTAARVQVSTGRIQLTSVSFPGFLRITPSESSEAKRLARGQAALLAVGDIVDFSSVSDLTAPTSRFTYMLAECFPDDSQTAQNDQPVQLAACSERDAAAAAQHAAAHALAAQAPVSVSSPSALASTLPPSATAAEGPLPPPAAAEGPLPPPAAAEGPLPPPAQQLPLQSNMPSLATGQPQLTPITVAQTDVPGITPDRPVSVQPALQNSLALPTVHDPVSVPQTSTSPALQLGSGTGLEVSLDSAVTNIPESMPDPADVASPAATALADPCEADASTGQLGSEAQTPGQQVSADLPDANALMQLAGAAQAATLPVRHPAMPAGQQPMEQQDGTQESADIPASSLQVAEPNAQAPNRVGMKTEPGSLPAQQAVIKTESDAVMEEADHRSAADVFEQTVVDCKAVLSDASSILLDKAAPDSSGNSTSRIAASERATMWHKELQGLLQRCKVPQLYIGVLGDTGAGKSSTINCLLGEENVLPVNGMRACTACVVEISHINSSVYEGTVECMTREEWTAQAKSLWGDLIDERGRLKICCDADRRLNTSSIEGAAQATLETVYGPNNLRRAGMTLERLLEVNNKITALLGRTISIREFAVKAFRKRIGEYVDSHNKKDEIQAWPLVKVCKLKHNWQALSTGAVVVDLPGVRDANAARGAVAEKYMKSCNAVWIVADITRAVDNRTAKDLLGENFRRQMLMDGQYGSITFICTKTDVIQVSETVRAFSQGSGSGRARMCEAAGVPLERYEQAQHRVDEKQDEVNKFDRIVKGCEKQAKPLNRAIKGLRQRLQNCQAKITRLESGGAIAPARIAAAKSDSDFEGDASAGSDSGGEYAPGNKRKNSRAKASSSRSKRRRKSESDSEVELGLFSSGDDDSSDDSDEEEEVPLPAKSTGRAPTSLPELQAQALELQAELDEKIPIVQTLKKDEREAAAQAAKVDRKLKQAQLAVSDICGRARNSYSKGVLKKDFKDGLLEMEETAADVELDAGGSSAAASPVGKQQRKQVDQELPVFCVSAKDCQRLEGRTSKDGPPSTFTKLEHTEMPQLRAHVHHVTEQGRLHAARSLASGLAQFINTTATTLVHHGTINAELQDACQSAFKRELERLLADVKIHLEAWKRQLQHECTQGSISPRLSSGAEAAENRAVATQAKWGAHKREGGYYWATYKATVQPARNGVYKSNASGEINFNADLARPILDGISMQWEILFGSTIINRLKDYKKTMLLNVADFLTAVKASLVQLGVDENRLHRITQEVQAHETRKCTDLLAKVAEDIQARQRDMSRDIIEPNVQNTMTEGYAACCAEVGSGQFDRMRRLMRATVKHHKGTMFAEAAGKLEAAMKAMVATVAKDLDKAQQSLTARIANTFTILWERPMCSITERRAAVARLQGLAGQMQGVCKGAGAPILELTLPKEEEDEEAQQENTNPNGVKVQPKQEDEDMEDFNEDDEEEQDDNDMEHDEEEEDEEEEEEEEEDDGLHMRFRNPYNDVAEDEEDEEEDDEEEDGEEEDGEEEEEDEGLLGMDVESEGEEEEELDEDALGGEAPKGPGYDQFGHMLGSGSPATQARRMELAGRDELNPGMIMLRPAAAGGPPQQASTPSFSAPHSTVKSEPWATPHDSAGGYNHGAQASAQLSQSAHPHMGRMQAVQMLPGSRQRPDGQTDAQQGLQQRSETECVKSRQEQAFGDMASIWRAAGHGLSLSVPRPPRDPFMALHPDLTPLQTHTPTNAQAAAPTRPTEGAPVASEPALKAADQTAIRPTGIITKSEPKPARLYRGYNTDEPPLYSTSVDTDEAEAAEPSVSTPLPVSDGSGEVESPLREGAAGRADAEAAAATASVSMPVSHASDEGPVREGAAGSGGAEAAAGGVAALAEVQREAALAAAQDAQEAERFAAQALQSPPTQAAGPSSKGQVSPSSLTETGQVAQPAAAAQEWLKQVSRASYTGSERIHFLLLQGLAEDVVQSGSSGVTAEDQQASRSDMPAAADGSSLKDSEPAVSGSVKAEVVNEATPAHASAAEAQQPKGGATSGSRSAWFGRAGGLLNRWAVPVKVKKEPKSTHKHGIADVIDLT